MANGDIYQIISKCYNNEQVNLNVYHYRRDSLVVDAGVDAQTLVDIFQTTVLDKVRAFQNTSVLHTEIYAQNLFNEADGFVKLISQAGQATNNDEAPVFLAVKFTLAHDNASIRKGRKAYSGLDETQMSNGVLTAGGVIAQLGTLASALSLGLPYGLIDTFFPVVVKRIVDGLTYRLPVNQGEAEYGGVTSVSYDPLVTTQNSRKLGRGI